MIRSFLPPGCRPTHPVVLSSDKVCSVRTETGGMETERVNYWITMSQWEWEYKLEIKSNKVPRMEALSNFSTLTQWQHNGPKLQHNFYIEFNLEHLRMASKMLYTCNFRRNVLKASDCTEIAALLKINHLVHPNMHKLKWTGQLRDSIICCKTELLLC